LYIEVHPVLEEDERTGADLMSIALDLLEVAASEGAGPLSGEDLNFAIQEQTGRPVRLARRLQN
jgi:hypothetical protein